MHAISDNGPIVIINLSEYRCDALIVARSTLDRPQVIPLAHDLIFIVNEWAVRLKEGTKDLEHHTITEAEFNRVVLHPILVGLWREIVKPVRTMLLGLALYARRLWWCPTGRLTLLPLHAVTNGVKLDIELLPLIPSYITTLSSLLEAQSSQPCNPEPISFLAVNCAAATGYTNLPSISEELQSLRTLCPNGTYLADAEATVGGVLSNIADHSWVHFSCHEFQTYKNPYLSHFVLSDGLLHMSDLIDQQLPNAQLAFLSACHTAAGDLMRYDEAMHLAAALQFVGFRGVIGTQWTVFDETAAQVVQEVYSYLFEDPTRPPTAEDAAEALHKAVLALRRKGIPLARLAPFIHFGV